MEKEILVALIMAIGPMFMALAAIIGSIATLLSIIKLKKEVNGRMTQLIREAKEKAFLEGQEFG